MATTTSVTAAAAAPAAAAATSTAASVPPVSSSPSPPPPSRPRDVLGFVHCPPGWSQARLANGPDAAAIRAIAAATQTTIAYAPDKRAIRIAGESNDAVFRAQTRLNGAIFCKTVETAPKKRWARPDRPGGWGQRRDLAPMWVTPAPPPSHDGGGAAASQHGHTGPGAAMAMMGMGAHHGGGGGGGGSSGAHLRSASGPAASGASAALSPAPSPAGSPARAAPGASLPLSPTRQTPSPESRGRSPSHAGRGGTGPHLLPHHPHHAMGHALGHAMGHAMGHPPPGPGKRRSLGFIPTPWRSGPLVTGAAADLGGGLATPPAWCTPPAHGGGGGGGGGGLDGGIPARAHLVGGPHAALANGGSGHPNGGTPGMASVRGLHGDPFGQGGSYPMMGALHAGMMPAPSSAPLAPSPAASAPTSPRHPPAPLARPGLPPTHLHSPHGPVSTLRHPADADRALPAGTGFHATPLHAAYGPGHPDAGMHGSLVAPDPQGLYGRGGPRTPRGHGPALPPALHHYGGGGGGGGASVTTATSLASAMPMATTPTSLEAVHAMAMAVTLAATAAAAAATPATHAQPAPPIGTPRRHPATPLPHPQSAHASAFWSEPRTSSHAAHGLAFDAAGAHGRLSPGGLSTAPLAFSASAAAPASPFGGRVGAGAAHASAAHAVGMAPTALQSGAAAGMTGAAGGGSLVARAVDPTAPMRPAADETGFAAASHAAAGLPASRALPLPPPSYLLHSPWTELGTPLWAPHDAQAHRPASAASLSASRPADPVLGGATPAAVTVTATATATAMAMAMALPGGSASVLGHPTPLPSPRAGGLAAKPGLPLGGGGGGGGGDGAPEPLSGYAALGASVRLPASGVAAPGSHGHAYAYGAHHAGLPPPRFMAPADAAMGGPPPPWPASASSAPPELGYPLGPGPGPSPSPVPPHGGQAAAGPWWW
ncbi:hypothetical protein CXG81DRAFT_24258 [Caulochytrium protostelioides]|uniref:K Homology domain-containing protein n=1 Tax=Caulochytrium protostelioides TaxID=1555241 RepID=A0A4P9XDC1_9FUNG|nr:hypothetical protein CXG81DRAFT_24258 [Caulochytrium protostelioides]|eukprot:RKP03151.1 hypothetical protein CXG81DRAFT_24258 [Caulochytrium protostelioides]